MARRSAGYRSVIETLQQELVMNARIRRFSFLTGNHGMPERQGVVSALVNGMQLTCAISGQTLQQRFGARPA